MKLGKQTKVVSQPLNEVVGHGENAKHVKDCTELYLGGKGIELLADFERLTNLEVLWLNDNRLTAITGLDSNVRIKQLYAHNNCICTLKGSLLQLKFLNDLDLSYNQLRDMKKVLQGLAHLRFLQQLNLQGNPCCEEPGYRLLLVQAMPSLQVLDHHQVTPAERLQAAAQIDHDAHVLNVAFGAGLPQSVLQHRTTAATQCRERSVLEQELAKRAEALRHKQQQEAEEAEAALFAHNPDADYWAPRSSMPPPAGLATAQQTWAAAAAAGSGTSIGQSVQHTEVTSRADVRGHAAGAQVQALPLTGSSGLSGSLSNGVLAANLTAGSPAVRTGAAKYIPKDVLVLRSPRKCTQADDRCSSSTAGTGSEQHGRGGGAVRARYLEGTFGHRLTDRCWEAEPSTIKL